MAESSERSEPLTGDAATSATGAAAAAIERAERAFAAGDHRAVRRELSGLHPDREELRERAAKLERALSPDPALIAVLVGCLVALFGVFAHYVLGGGR
jgi:hypothetical protein